MLAKNDLVIDGGLRSLEICKRAGVEVGYGTDLLGALQVEESREFLHPPRSALADRDHPAGDHRSARRSSGRKASSARSAAGAFADLILIDGDPLKNLGLFQEQGKHIPAIMKGGKFHKNKLNGVRD